MEERVFIKYLWEGGHGSTQIQSKLVEHYEDKALSYPDVRYWMRHVRRGDKALKTGDAAEDRQTLKFISESREHSKHCPMLQFETFFRLPEFLCQRYSMFSFKFFIWNFVTGDGSPTN
jgi:hypothetical protein